MRSGYFGSDWFTHLCYCTIRDTSNPPKSITNRYGRVVLAKGGIALDYGMLPALCSLDYAEHDFLDSPLANGFDILDGRVVVKVPKVKAGKDYSIVREYL